MKRCRRTVIFLPVYKISSLKITPPKTPNSGQFSYPLPNMVSFLFRLEFRFRSRDFSLNLFPVWQPYCWRFWSAIVVHIHASTINVPELRERSIWWISYYYTICHVDSCVWRLCTACQRFTNFLKSFIPIILTSAGTETDNASLESTSASAYKVYLYQLLRYSRECAAIVKALLEIMV